MAEIGNTKPRKKRKLVPYIEMGDLLYVVLKNCHNKNRAVIKINYFPFCKVCTGRKLAQTAREMRKHSFDTVLRMLFHNLSLPPMPFLIHVPALCSWELSSHCSSIKLSHIFLWSVVHSLSHHCTISLPTSCWNCTLREPPSCSLVSPIRAQGPLTPEGACTAEPQSLPLKSACIHILKNYEMWHDEPTEATLCVPDSQSEKIKWCLSSSCWIKRIGNFLLSTWN